MQHDGAGFSVSGALRYEMDIAAKALRGQQGAGTQQRNPRSSRIAMRLAWHKVLAQWQDMLTVCCLPEVGE
jgi:hypothetical protein